MKIINNDVNLDHLALREIPSVLDGITITNGGLDVSYNSLTDLKNSPVEIDTAYNCSHNRKLSSLSGISKRVGALNATFCSLTNLEGFPEIKSQYYSKMASRLMKVNLKHNQLTSLKGLPNDLPASLSLSFNPLTSLEGCSKIIGGKLDLVNTNIKSMVGGPSLIAGDLDLVGSSINTVVGFPANIYGDIFIGDTPLGKLIFEGPETITWFLKLLKDYGCTLHGSVYESEEDYLEQREEAARAHIDRIPGYDY